MIVNYNFRSAFLFLGDTVFYFFFLTVNFVHLNIMNNIQNSSFLFLLIERHKSSGNPALLLFFFFLLLSAVLAANPMSSLKSWVVFLFCCVWERQSFLALFLCVTKAADGLR